MKLTRVFLIAIVAVLMLPTALLAEERTGSVDGTVLDDQGLVVPGATVVLAGPTMMGDKVAVSDAEGRFRFVLVPPGRYSIEISLSGFNTVVNDNVPVALGQTAILEVTLSPASFAETITVSADQVLIDTTSSSVGGNLTGEFVETLANDRQYQTVMTMMPGSIDANNPLMHGASGGDNIYLVDGADSSDPMTRTWSASMNFDNLQEIQVLTGGMPAEYGKGTGAVVNLVTKSGSNELHGVVRYTYSDTSLNSDLRGDRYYFSDATKYLDEKRPAFNIGGAIVKDRLWFFTSYEKRDKKKLTAYYSNEQDSLNGIRTQSSTSYKGHYFTGKLTGQISPEHTVFAHYTEDPIDIPDLYAYTGYQVISPSADALRFQGGWNAIVDWTGVLTPDSFVDAKYNVKRNELNNEVNVPTGTTYYNGLVYWGAGYRDYRTARDHDIYAFNYNHFIDTPAGGHELKAGIEYSDIALRYRAEYYAGGTYVRYSTGTQNPLYKLEYSQRHGWIDYGTETWTAFAQDTWRVDDRLTFNLGVRLENLKSLNNQGDEIVDWGWGERVQPRLGFAYELGDGSLHGSVGRYHDTVYDVMTIDFSPTPDEIYDRYSWDSSAQDWVFYRQYVVGAAFATRDSNIESPYMDELTFGYQGKLSPTMAWGVDGIYRRWEKGIEDDDGQLFAGFEDNPPDDGNYHYMNLGKFREYKGVELSLRKMLAADRLQFLASYTWSDTKGYWGDDDALSGFADNPYRYVNYWGYAPYDHSHVVKFNGSYLLPWGFVAGANFIYMSGAPYNTTATVLSSDGYTYSSYYVTERGSERLPSTWTLDMRFEKNFKLGPVTAGLYVDFFNITDNQEAVAIDSSLGIISLDDDEPGADYTVVSPNPDFDTYSQWQAPRSVFVGAKIEF